MTPGTETAEDYTGHELDGETGMHYAGARYYMSGLGRFGSNDPYMDDYPGHSPYHYAANNPARIVDPTGKFWVDYNENGHVRAGRFGVTSAAIWYLPTILTSWIPQGKFASRGLTGVSDLMASGNTDYSFVQPSYADYAVAAMGSATGSSMRAAKQMRSSAGYFDKLHMAKADNLAFNAIAAAHGKGLLKVSIDGRSHNLLSDVGPGTFTLGLNTTVQGLWEKNNGDPVDKFANLLGSTQKVASNLLNHFDDESDAQQALNQWMEATQKAENIHDSAEACQFAKDAGAVGADGC